MYIVSIHIYTHIQMSQPMCYIYTYIKYLYINIYIYIYTTDRMAASVCALKGQRSVLEAEFDRPPVKSWRRSAE